jgi:hypothetical protein
LQRDKFFKLLNDHMETAFKLSIRPESHYRNRAYQWLEAIIDISPLIFWVETKRRTVKSIYTHAVEVSR